MKRLQELEQEVSLFLKNKNNLFAEKIESESFLYAYSTWQIFSVIITMLIVLSRDQV